MQVNIRDLKSKILLPVLGIALAVTPPFFSGCAAGSRGTQQPGAVEPPSVGRLKDGRQGFVIRENAAMDGGTRQAFEQAVALLQEGENEKAAELLEKVIERAPGVSAPHINAAAAYMRMHRPEEAEKHLKTALALVPNHPVASNEYGLLLRKSGRFKEAREIYEKAAERFPDYLPVHKNLGILCDLYINDPECALRQFEIYLAAMPADEQVKIWVAELRMRLGR